MRRLVPAKLLTLTLLCATVACGGSDSTGPGPRNPLAGTWDVATVLESYNVEVGCPTYGYCTQRYPPGEASLSGQLVINPVVMDTAPTATFTGAFCDTLGDTGCTHVGPPTVVQMDQGSVTRSQSWEDWNQLEIFVRGPDDPAAPSYYHTYEHIYLTEVTVDGDSMSGKVYWARYIARNPPHYLGTFVAHRR